MTHKIKVTKQIEVTDENIDDIICDAFEGGITYWCDNVEVVGKYLGEYASDQISRGGKLILHDFEEDKEYELTLEKFLNGYKLAVEDGIFDGDADGDEYDGGVADCIIQYAIFDEIVYG